MTLLAMSGAAVSLSSMAAHHGPLSGIEFHQKSCSDMGWRTSRHMLLGIYGHAKTGLIKASAAFDDMLLTQIGGAEAASSKRRCRSGSRAKSGSSTLNRVQLQVPMLPQDFGGQ